MTTKAKALAHTPGPWFVNEHAPCSVECNYKTQDSNIICMQVWGRDWGEAYANARLIAAAPELIEACQRLTKNAICTCADGGEGFECDVCQANAAIAKATGN